jgi:hypothetical protein
LWLIVIIVKGAVVNARENEKKKMDRVRFSLKIQRGEWARKSFEEKRRQEER